MRRCVVRDANMGHQLAGGNSSWCPELEVWTTQGGGRTAKIMEPTFSRLIGMRAISPPSSITAAINTTRGD